MTKNAVFFVSHFYNDFILAQCKRISEHLPSNYDLIFCTTPENIEAVSNNCDIHMAIEYHNEDIKSVGDTWNPLAIIQDSYRINEEIRSYNRYFLIEYDVYSATTWDNIFKLCENDNVDLYAAYIKKMPYKTTGPWMWSNDYVSTHEDGCSDNKINSLLKSCLSFMVLSHDALDFIVNYDKSDLTDYIYEMYVPTLLYNYGYTVKSLSSIITEDDEEFNDLYIIHPKNYYYSVSFNDYAKMDEIANGQNMLFTTYKSQKKKYIIRNFIDKNASIQMSIVMPVYNAEKYLAEAIESVLSQENAPSYELIIVNDGSTDSSNDIIEKYASLNNCIVVINREHSGIVDSLNAGIKNAIGKYIVRFDSDDIMYTNRLAIQYDYMEEHPNVDICGFGFEWGNNKPTPEYFSYDSNSITFEQLKYNNCIGHPTVIMRKDSILKLPFLYESYFEKCEDYKLWCTAVLHGLHIASCSEPVIWYRQHDGQETNSSSEIMWKNTDRIKHGFQSISKDTDGEITVIIPFKNEGMEIEKTVFTIRATSSKKLPIILINDGSNDNYNYKEVADLYDCIYIENETSIGVAQSRDLGVKTCETEYFMLLDAHMRFYDDNWYEYVLKCLKDNPTAILSSETTVISKNDDNEYKNEAGHDKYHGAGAYINFDEPGFEFTGKWTHVKIPGYEDSELLPTPCLMGACYCSNKTWWTYIGGLYGLIMWGQDEPLISLKTWLAGGQILLMTTFDTGHVYREKPPYNFPANQIYSNSIWLNHLFTHDKEEIKKLDDNLRKRINDQCFNEAMEFYKKHETELEKYKDIFWSNMAVHDLNWFKAMNNKCYIHPEDKK